MHAKRAAASGDSPPRLILVAGASGYIGGRLLSALSARGERVRAMARRPMELQSRVTPDVEVVVGDVLDASSLASAMEGVDTAYYLIHAMASPHDFEREEREGAENFARAARDAGIRRIVYLGGLGADDLSPHLASRQNVGRILRDSGVPTIEFRASIILGSGSLSFELVRSLVERLPLLIVPRWASQLTQPIAIEDLIAYLVGGANVKLVSSQVVEIGGPDRVSYLDLMREYAKQRSLPRRFVSVPVLTPWLSSRWLGLVTPVYARVGRKLIDSLRSETVVSSPLAATLFPDIRPRGMHESMARALANENREFAETRWSDAQSSIGSQHSWGGTHTGSRIIDSREATVAATPAAAFRAIERIGGASGWYYGDWLWRLRGSADLLVGGAGMRRGRRDPHKLRCGDALDFWRVEALEPDRMVRLRAEMKLPGRAWLQFEVTGDGANSTIVQTAVFEPHGLAGLIYWYVLYPVHALIFRGMLDGIVGHDGSLEEDDRRAGPRMKRGQIIVNDRMQQGYRYVLLEPTGRNYDAGFAPQLTPPQLLALGVFGGRYMTDCADEFPPSWYRRAKLSPERDPSLNYFGVNASQPLSVWRKKRWIYHEDPRGWFQWYCRYYLGRRSLDDARQIRRWRQMARHVAQVRQGCKKGDLECRRRQRQALLHWAYDSRKI